MSLRILSRLLLRLVTFCDHLRISATFVGAPSIAFTPLLLRFIIEYKSTPSPQVRKVESRTMLIGKPVRASVNVRQIDWNSSTTALPTNAAFTGTLASAPRLLAYRAKALSISATSGRYPPFAN